MQSIHWIRQVVFLKLLTKLLVLQKKSSTFIEERCNVALEDQFADIGFLLDPTISNPKSTGAFSEIYFQPYSIKWCESSPELKRSCDLNGVGLYQIHQRYAPFFKKV
eukprot:NODE_512_length_7384_cov_0.221123.p4 type:complete len:107 gc:universal NODE_512_length_7384_cov_0.221123:5870-5550(-)